MSDAEKNKEKTVYVIDLRHIKGTGDFQCPHPSCGSNIDPDNETSYVFRDQIYRDKEKTELQELNIRCTKCESDIRIVGFE